MYKVHQLKYKVNVDKNPGGLATGNEVDIQNGMIDELTEKADTNRHNIALSNQQACRVIKNN